MNVCARAVSAVIVFGVTSVALAGGFSGFIDAKTTDPKGKSPYQRVMTDAITLKPGSIYRFSLEANVDKAGKLTFGPNHFVKDAPHFYRLCKFNAEPGWRTYSFKIWIPTVKDAPALVDTAVKFFVGIDRGGPITHVDFRNVRAECLPPPPPPSPTCRWKRRGKNGFFNSSFELGLDAHAVVCNTDYVNDSMRAEWSIDETVAKHGRRSLKIDNRTFGKTVEFMTAAGGFSAPAGKEGVTISAWVKADRPVKAMLLVRDLVYDYDRAQSFWSGCPRSFQVGTEWQRLELCMWPDECHAQYTMWLRFSDPAVVWVDAIQIENGRKASDFEPAAPVEVSLTCQDTVLVKQQRGFFERLFRKEKPSVATIKAINYTSEPQRAECNTDCGAAILEVPVGGTVERKLEFTLSRYGCFEFGGEFSCQAGRGSVLPFGCAVVGAIPAENPSNVFYTGFNAATLGVGDGAFPDGWLNAFRSAGDYTVSTHFRNLRLAGCRMLRNHDDATGWWTIERKKGEYDWKMLDRVVDECVKNGIEPLYVFGNGIVTIRNTTNPDTFKDWFVRKNSKIGTCIMKNRECYLPDEKDWFDFYTALVRRYRGRIRYYEVINEPNGTMPVAEDYFRYLKLSYEIVKANDPDAKVVGICSTGDYGADTGAFIEKIGKLGGFKYFDILSFHPYAAPLDNSTQDGEDQLREIRALVDRFSPGMPILQDEIYYLSPVDERRISGKPRDDAGLSNCWRDGNLIRRYVIDIAGGSIGSVSVNGGQLQQMDPAHKGCIGAGTFSAGWSPNGRFVAANAFARIMGGCKFVAKPKVNDSINAFLFLDRNGKEVVIAWVRNDDAEPREIVLPNGMSAMDVYGNDIKSQRLEFGPDPVYFTGKGLSGKISEVLK